MSLFNKIFEEIRKTLNALKAVLSPLNDIYFVTFFADDIATI